MADIPEIPVTLTPENALIELHKLDGSDDAHSAHMDGDAILCAVLRHLGQVDVADAWEAMAEHWYYS